MGEDARQRKVVEELQNVNTLCQNTYFMITSVTTFAIICATSDYM